MATVNIFQAQLQKFMNAPNQPPQRTLERKARNVLADAIQNAPVDRSGRTDLDHPAGQLRDSLTIGFTIDRGQRVARIFSNAVDRSGEPYAKHVIRGTGGHRIEGNPALVFQWTKFGNRKAVMQRGVNHPGTPPNNWLKDALRAILR